MDLGGGRYRKIQVRSDQARRWAKLRKLETKAPSAPAGTGAKLVADYLLPDDAHVVPMKKAAIFALVFHLLVFLIVVPKRAPEVIDAVRADATVVKKYSPPAPPAKAKKTRPKKKASVVPIPDPTPNEPEPVELEASEEDLGEFDEEFLVGVPTGVPGVSSGARGKAYKAGDGGIMSPVVVRQVDPEYTPEATRRGIQGEVWIEAVVGIDGKVSEPVLLRGLPDEELNNRAMEAIRRWVFKPGRKDGEAVAVIAVFTVTYRLH